MAITVKVCYEGRKGDAEIRRFNVTDDAESLYDVIETKISEVFENLQRGDFNMFWKDEDGDLVIISTQEELTHALHEAQDGLLRIVLKDKDGGVTSPDGKLANGPVSTKQQRIQQRREDKARQPPRWMRRCREAMPEGEPARRDLAAFMAQDLARRRWRSGFQSRGDNSGEMCQTTVEHARGCQGRRVQRADNPEGRPHLERLRRSEGRQQQMLEGVKRQSETEGGEGHPRLMPRWMARRFAQESQNPVSGNENKSMNESGPRPIPRWMARRMAREAEASQEMTPVDGSHPDMDSAEVEEAGGLRCKNPRFWRRVDGETTGDVNFASCQRRRLRRMRQEAIMRANASEREGESEGTSGGWKAKKFSGRKGRFQEENVEAESVMGGCTNQTNIREEPCHMKKVRHGQRFGRMRQPRNTCRVAGETLETDDAIWRQRRMAQRQGRPCRRTMETYFCNADSGACPKVRVSRNPGRPNRETALTNYRLRVLRRLRRMRQLRAHALSDQAGPRCAKGRSFRRPGCPQETFSTCGKGCMTSPRNNKRVLFSVKPYHGFRRFGGQMKARAGCHKIKEHNKTTGEMSQDIPVLRWFQLTQKRQLLKNFQRTQLQEMKRGFRKAGLGKRRHLHKQMAAGHKTCPMHGHFRQNALNRHVNRGCFNGPLRHHQKAPGQKRIKMTFRQAGKRQANFFTKADLMRAWPKGCQEGLRHLQNRRMMRGNGFGRVGLCAGGRYQVFGY